MTTEIVKAPIIANGRGLTMTSMDDMWRLSTAIAHARGMAPSGLDTPEKILIVLQAGAELGLTPMRSLASIYVVNGKTNIYGDTPLALVRQSGLMEFITEDFEGKGDNLIAVCVVKRKDDPEPVTRTFGVADAMTAKLWAKSGPWTNYPKRMLQMRARALALRDVFPDCFAGAVISEEYVGVPSERSTPKSAALVEDSGTKQIDSVVTDDMLEEPGDWARDHVPDKHEADEPIEPKVKYRCKNGHEFAVPLPPDGQCPVCLVRDVVEIEEVESDS